MVRIRGTATRSIPSHPGARTRARTLAETLGAHDVSAHSRFLADGRGDPGVLRRGEIRPASHRGVSVAFALATSSTYVMLCVASLAGLQNVRCGSLERYGEVLSGAFIALVEFLFMFSRYFKTA